MERTSRSGRKATKLVLDYRLTTIVLFIVVVAMLAVWQPWRDRSNQDRTIEVTGQSTLTAKPDAFVFYPTYDFKNSDKQAALRDLGAKSSEITAKLHSLGVAESKIKTSSDNQDMPAYASGSDIPTYTLRFTVTVNNRDLAQKVQDYLIATSPSGAVSPQASFSEKKRTQLENQARDAATKDARAKADQSAKNLGFRLGAVQGVDDGTGFNNLYTTDQGAARPAELKLEQTRPQLSLQPGENELTYSVTVTYRIK